MLFLGKLCFFVAFFFVLLLFVFVIPIITQISSDITGAKQVSALLDYFF